MYFNSATGQNYECSVRTKCVCKKVDCEWNDWTNGACSKSCGGGIRTNVRTERVSKAHGGKPCEGAASVEENCNAQGCPG